MLQSTINNSLYCNSKEYDAKSDPKSNSLVAPPTSDIEEIKITDTETINGCSPHTLLTNREIPAIIHGVIPMVKQTTADRFPTIRRDLHAVRVVIHKEIIMGVTRSTTGVIKDPPVVNCKEASRPILVDKNTVEIPPRTTTQVLTVIGPSAPPIGIGSYDIEGRRQSITLNEGRNAEPLDASINIFPDKHRYPTPGWSKIVGSKVVTDKSANVYARGRMNFKSDTVLSENPNFINFRLSPVNTTDKLGSVIVPTTRVGSPINGSYWLQPGPHIEEATADRVSKTKAKNHCNFKS